MKTLYEKFTIYARLSSFECVYTGADFKAACKAVGEKTAEKYGKGGTLHASPETMEMAVEEHKNIVGYAGHGGFANDFVGLVRK